VERNASRRRALAGTQRHRRRLGRSRVGFHTEGFVNTYVQQPSADDKTIVFVSEAIENIPAGYRARETYTILSRDEFTERFEIAEPGKDFELYSEARLKRIR
jgi:hypothetical protein